MLFRRKFLIICKKSSTNIAEPSEPFCEIFIVEIEYAKILLERLF